MHFRRCTKGARQELVTQNPLLHRHSSPSPQLIELVRIQIEIIFNPKSRYRKSANSLFGLPPLTEAEEKQSDN